MQEAPSACVLSATLAACSSVKSSGSTRAATSVPFFLSSIRRSSEGPTDDVALTSGSHEFVHECIVDVDIWPFRSEPEFSPEFAATVATCYDGHKIL